MTQPAEEPRSDGWATATTPEPQPEHVLIADAVRSAEALGLEPLDEPSAPEPEAPLELQELAVNP